MKAIIAGTPIQIDAEPAELAQLVALLRDGAVLIEHQHHFTIGEPDAGNDIVHGSCWCGVSRDFQAWKSNPEQRAAAAAAVGAGRKCRRCGGTGHRKDKCPQR